MILLQTSWSTRWVCGITVRWQTFRHLLAVSVLWFLRLECLLATERTVLFSRWKSVAALLLHLLSPSALLFQWHVKQTGLSVITPILLLERWQESSWGPRRQLAPQCQGKHLYHLHIFWLQVMMALVMGIPSLQIFIAKVADYTHS